MSSPLSPVLSDPARLAVLRDAVRPRAYPATAYDHVTRVAAVALDVPVALVSLVDDQGQFFHGLTGLLGEIAVCRSTPLSHSFCKHVVEQGAPLRIVDARVHPLVHDNPVIDELGVVGYLGVPLTTSDGHCLGSLCAITHEPRDWTPGDEAVLRDLSRIVLSDLELRAELSHVERQSTVTQPSRDAEGLPESAIDLLEQLHEGVAAIDRQWHLTFVNEVGARALEVDREQVHGRVLWECLPQVIGTPFERLLREAAVARQSLELEAQVQSTGRWFDVRVLPARHGLSVYFTDTTDRRRTIEALQLREEQLRQAQKLEAIGALAGGIAHDFNNLLTVIRANADLLLEAEDDHASQRAEDLTEIRHAASRAASLTQQLLAFGRKPMVEPHPVHIGHTVRDLTPILRRLVSSRVELDARTPDELPLVHIDPGQLEQVVMNLVVNARDAMPDGGLLRVHTSTVELHQPTKDALVVVPAGRWVTLSVQDTGTGITPEHLPHIFEPFFTTKALGKGTGLGLATVFRIVHETGGCIAVDSRTGRGTTMRVYLPAILDEVHADEIFAPTVPESAMLLPVDQS